MSAWLGDVLRRQCARVQDEESLLAQLRAMPTTGTIVIISGLRRDDSGALELDFDSDT